ncbi:hypothetical protein [Methylorubrum extorquens]|uniref:Uncharacterized protein n=1 Tax=Methylorubrum extorquens (strain CM4 / NCIMB 13688) TaxID=440085 RepID=B7KSV9_METC4|nr:hypothetical protein [Methylorubrum extorquens]ACK82461.1 hypothetical protein Mchl_1597 [Methylorubrum extorquens CM4]
MSDRPDRKDCQEIAALRGRLVRLAIAEYEDRLALRARRDLSVLPALLARTAWLARRALRDFKVRRVMRALKALGDPLAPPELPDPPGREEKPDPPGPAAQRALRGQ